jgi:hypothetical protein
MTLLRGVADDVPLMDWLQNHIWPLEKQWVSEAWTYLGSKLAAAEGLRSGTTYINDMYFFPTAMARAAVDSGVRAAVSMNVIDFPTGYASGPDDYIAKGLAAYEQYKGEALLDWTSAPHAPYTVSDETFVKLRDLAEKLDIQMHCHIHETAGEVSDGLKAHGMRPIARLDKLGLFSERMIAVHMVHLDEAEIELMASKGVHLVHNPNSNLKLASGVMPLKALEAAGVNTILGTDGAASNNSLNMLSEIRSAALSPRRARRWRWRRSALPRPWAARTTWARWRSASWPTVWPCRWTAWSASRSTTRWPSWSMSPAASMSATSGSVAGRCCASASRPPSTCRRCWLRCATSSAACGRADAAAASSVQNCIRAPTRYCRPSTSYRKGLMP